MLSRKAILRARPASRRGSFVSQWLPLVVLLALQPVTSAAQLNQTGRWRGLYELGSPYPNGYPGVHVAVLKGRTDPTGTVDTTCVLMFGQTGKYGVWSFAPGNGLTVPTNNVNFFGVTAPGHDLFCSGHASVNGRLVVVGGQYRPEVGTESAWEFNPLYTHPSNPDPTVPPWRQLESMARGRWYASVTSLSTHQLLATSGTKYGYAFMFGGDTGTLENDLRPLGMGNKVDWAVPVASGETPSPRKDHTAVLERYTIGNPYLTRMIVFGGETGPGQKSRDVRSQYLRGDTDSSSIWSQPVVFEDSQYGLPEGRSRHSAIYYAQSSGDSMMIIYGGSNASGSALGDVWKAKLDTPTINADTLRWTRLLDSSGTDDESSGPGSRYGHTAIFDPGPNGNAPRMVVFGGRSSSTSLASNNVWSLNLPIPNVTYVPQWTRIDPSDGVPPGAREGHAAVADDYKDGVAKFRMVVFGGHNGVSALADTTWSLWRATSDNVWTWTRVTGTTPPARSRAAAMKDWLWDRMVVFGGQDNSGFLDDLWALDLGNSGTALTWSPILERNPLAKPAARTMVLLP